jgi:hypothetical protein
MKLLESKVARLWLAAAVAALLVAGAFFTCAGTSVPLADPGAPSSGSASAATLRPTSPPPARTARLDGAKSTRDILNALAKDCLSCAEQNGCLDSKQSGDVCENATGTSKISGQPEAELCLDALRCILTSRCANIGEESPCLCGKTDILSCMEGKAPPAGACVAEFKKDFGDDPKTLYKEFINPAYGAGRANSLIQCVMPLCPSCRIP